MMGALGALAGADEVRPDQLKKQLLRHQIPVAAQVEALVQVLAYQKSLIPEHVINPLIDSVIQHVTTELNNLKINEEASRQRTMDALKQVEKQVDSGQLKQIEKAIEENK